MSSNYTKYLISMLWKKETNYKWVHYLLYHWRDGLQAAGSSRELAIKATCLHLATHLKLCQFIEDLSLKKIQLIECVTWGNSWKAPAVSWFWSEEPPITTTGLQRQHTFINQPPTGPILEMYTAASVCWIILYQQFTLALAIPPRAWMSPGPDTTRQAPGLDTRNHRRHMRYKLSHQLLTIFCVVTLCLTSQSDIQQQMLHNMPVVWQNVLYIKMLL